MEGQARHLGVQLICGRPRGACRFWRNYCSTSSITSTRLSAYFSWWTERKYREESQGEGAARFSPGFCSTLAFLHSTSAVAAAYWTGLLGCGGSRGSLGPIRCGGLRCRKANHGLRNLRGRRSIGHLRGRGDSRRTPLPDASVKISVNEAGMGTRSCRARHRDWPVRWSDRIGSGNPQASSCAGGREATRRRPPEWESRRPKEASTFSLLWQ